MQVLASLFDDICVILFSTLSDWSGTGEGLSRGMDTSDSGDGGFELQSTESTLDPLKFLLRGTLVLVWTSGSSVK